MTVRLHGNPGDPVVAFGGKTTPKLARKESESMPNNRTKGERQRGDRKSDRLIVPTKAGNAAGGKETTDGRAK